MMTPIFVLIKCELGFANDVAADIVDNVENVSEVYSTSGQYDLLAKFNLARGADIGSFVTKHVQTRPHIRDTFTQDEDGYFHFVARSDDMIISGGYNIAGPEVEAALLAHPHVAECAVVGAPDEARGQIVEAHVVLAEGVEACDAERQILQDHVKATIAPYKYPRSVRFTDALPKTQTGKIQRFRLRG